MRCTLLIAALTLGVAAPALSQTQEGTFKGTYSSYGTYKAMPVGKERLLVTFDENGLQVTNGFADHLTMHCSGWTDYMSGAGQSQGFCIGTDPAGDQLTFNFGPDEKHAPDQKSWKGSARFTSGSGKYEGLSGTIAYVIHSNEFRPPAEGAFVNYVTFEGKYEIPATGSTAPPVQSK